MQSVTTVVVAALLFLVALQGPAATTSPKLVLMQQLQIGDNVQRATTMLQKHCRQVKSQMLASPQ